MPSKTLVKIDLFKSKKNTNVVDCIGNVATQLVLQSRPPAVTSTSRDPHAAPVQLHGCRPGEKWENSRPGHLLPCSWRQQHSAELLWGRRHNPAGSWGPRRLALRREWEDEDVSATSVCLVWWLFRLLKMEESRELLMLDKQYRVFCFVKMWRHLLQARLVSFLLHQSDHWEWWWLHEATSSTQVGISAHVWFKNGSWNNWPNYSPVAWWLPCTSSPQNSHKPTCLSLIGPRGQLVYTFLVFQPPPRQEQQHRQPSRERRHGSPRPWLQHPVPYGGTDCCCAAWQTTTPLQCGGARLLTGGGPAKQPHRHTYSLASTHTLHTWHMSWAVAQNPSKIWARLAESAADLRCSRGTA